ncbi:hypothetical protein [Pelagicoccus mobilis]|uniref:Uncharacterized protein n=1 Tax=Pelagicoccus mobilis TaxID=415221 RepID=A0A934S1Z1_9BACT|nr:hypothetical protein [Pelagicoccus mobilis]MBK1879136.1 hypothetical protein [Pelagicoccus mobilis]
MKKNKVVLLVVMLASLLSNVSLQAQEDIDVEHFVDVVRETVKKDRIIVISESMRFEPHEAAVFWPIYEKYIEEMAVIQNARIDLIKDYFTDLEFETTGETATELTIRAFDLTEQRLKIRRKYYAQISTELDAAQATRFMQIDRVIDSAIDLKIAQAMPAFPTKLTEIMESATY